MAHSRKVVLVMGPGHCGSTLLDLLLGSHSSAFSLAEFHVISRYVVDPTASRQAVCAICADNCDFWNRVAPFDALRPFYARATVLDRLRGHLERMTRNPYEPMFEATKKTTLIDSSKSPRWFAGQLRWKHTWRDTDAYLLYLGRDGRGVANSYRRKYPERGMEWATQRWKNGIVAMNRFYETFPFPHRKTRVRYEELTSDPVGTIRTLCDFLGLDFEPAMLEYWTHAHHPVAGNAGATSLVIRERERRGLSPRDHHKRVNENDRFYSSAHYEQLGLGIAPDMRWQTELSAEDEAVFTRLADGLNEPFVWSQAPGRIPTASSVR